MRRDDPNIEMLQLAADGLGSLLEDVVFVGGCAAGLLITDPAAPPTRETMDVDMIVEVASSHDYHILSEKLRNRGFREDQSEGAPMCRWLYRSVKVDVMPTDSTILGFSNRWYTDAMLSARNMRLPVGINIRMVTAPFFLATKLEAFYGRGNGDYMASHDLEDLIAVLDGRDSIVSEVQNSGAVALYLAEAYRRLLALDEFHDALPCHLPTDAASQMRVAVLIERMAAIGGTF
jgi:predicted nucleotidyltransferase